MDNHYHVLGVGKSASFDEIKYAYKKRALEVHPDKNYGQETTAQFQKLKQAYDVLTDAPLRATYDHQQKQKQDQEQTGKYTAPSVDPRIVEENQVLIDWRLAVEAEHLELENNVKRQRETLWQFNDTRTPEVQLDHDILQNLEARMAAAKRDFIQSNPNWTSLDWITYCHQVSQLSALQTCYFKYSDIVQKHALKSITTRMGLLPYVDDQYQQGRIKLRQKTAKMAVQILDLRKDASDRLKGNNFQAKLEAWMALSVGEELAKLLDKDIRYGALCAEFDKWQTGRRSDILELLRE